VSSTLLIINRHDLRWTTGEGRYLSIPGARRALLTRTFGGGLNGWRRSDYALTQVAEMSDLEHVARVCRWIARTMRPTHILALHEKDLLVAARLREELSLPGPREADILPYRDKYLMKQRAAAAGVPVPRFGVVADVATIPGFSWDGPTVSKDRWGLGASSIRFWEDLPAALAGLLTSRPGDDALLLEERIEGEMYYCDSVVVNGETLFANVSQYLVVPGDYHSYDWQADISPVDPDVEVAIRALNEVTLDAMGRHDAVTHAEYFRDRDGNYHLCEIAARPGGGGVDLLVRHATGVDLVACAVAIAEGHRPDVEVVPAGSVYVLLGLYPCEAGTSVPDGGRYGVVHHQSASSASRGGPRHATDYTDMYVLRAADRDQAEDLLRGAVRASGRSVR